MIGSNYSSSFSFFLRTIVLLLFSISNVFSTFASLKTDLCHPDQRDVLLQLKTEFKIQKPDKLYDYYWMNVTSYPKTESWGNRSTDCCNWDGVTCNTESGKVIGLDLSCSCLHGRLEPNSSLFRLKHLTSLNLAYNNFTLSPIPAKFNNLMLLETLNLSRSSLKGHIPREILQLTNLVSLDLSPYYSPSLLLSIENPPLFLRLLAQNLRNLRALDMSYVNISSEIPHEFSYMPSLRSLHLTSCYLVGEFPSGLFMIQNLQSIILDRNPDLRGSLPVFRRNNSLQVLSLLETSFSGIIPDSIGNLKHLVDLRLAESNFSGRIPFSLGELSNLSSLSLYQNHFTGEVPSSIGNLKQLISFDVSSNQLTGNFPSALLNLTKLRSIILDSNQFTGSLPPNIGQLSKLEGLYAYGNSFTGAVPSSLLQISSLTELYLDDYQLSDLVGFENVSLLSNLQDLSFESNNFRVSSPVDLNVFSSLKQLVTLSLSGIPLSTANITSDSDFSSNFEDLYLSGCNITEFPEFLRDQSNLKYLYLSNNNIKGQVPDWLWRLQALQSLYLSDNSLSGFDGSLKAVPGSHIEMLNLEYLDLSNNNIKGQVPDWLWRLQELQFLDLSHNSLSGFDGSLKAVPGSHIEMLDLRSNAFQGRIFIPYTSINYLFASSNNFTGEIPRSLCGGGQSSPTIIDLSNNNFHGSIPQCLGTNMSSLADLNLRNNSLSGSLPDMFIHAYELSFIDVSHNRLDGKLPQSLTACSALEVLNVESNEINDTFPFQLSSLQKLQVLVLRSNRFRGVLYQSDRAWFGFPQLKIIDVSNNDFLGTLPSDYFLNWTAISSNEDKDRQPHYIGDSSLNYRYYSSVVLMNKGVSMAMERILTVYTAIDFSGNRIHGPIPQSIGLLKELHVLNLSRNAFTGDIPSSLANITALESLDLSQNMLSGEIPRSLCSGQSSPTIIDLSNNNFHGSIPQCLGTHMSFLMYLNLRNNSLSGSLPDMFMHAYELSFIDVSHNRLEGKLPESLTACSALEVLNVESNEINDIFPFQLSSLKKLQVLVLRSNKFHGMLHHSDGVWFGFPKLKIIDVSHNEFLGTLPSDYFLNWTAISSNEDKDRQPHYIGDSLNYRYYSSVVLMNKGVSMVMERILTVYTAIDFSGNRIHGEIPESIGLLKELHVLNLSRNAFTGHIPSSLANITALESLDLSQNKLSGEIPPKLGDLSSVEWINVSHNQLVGSIPQGTQFQRQACSSYEGNPGLFGPSLKNICRETTSLESEPPVSSEEEEEEEGSFSWVAAGLGFAPGVVFGFTTGYIKKNLGRNKH